MNDTLFLKINSRIAEEETKQLLAVGKSERRIRRLKRLMKKLSR